MTWFNIVKRQEDIQADIVSFLVQTLDIPLAIARQQVDTKTIDENMKFANWLSGRMQAAMPQEKFMQIAEQGNPSRKIDSMYDYISGNLPPSQRERDEQFQQVREDRNVDSRIKDLGRRGADIEQRRKDRVDGKKSDLYSRLMFEDLEAGKDIRRHVKPGKLPSAYRSGQLASRSKGKKRRDSFLARNKGNKSPQGKAALRGWGGESWKE
mgnify:CR=1 FL=1